tara:strand:- start:10642 stop:10911 length:270 start_codon:yes stop_codon:yes gene_type:complete
MGELSLIEAGALGIAAFVLLAVLAQLAWSNRAKDKIIEGMAEKQANSAQTIANALLAVNVTLARIEAEWASELSARRSKESSPRTSRKT